MGKKQQNQVEGSNSLPLCQEKRVKQGKFTVPVELKINADEGVLLTADKLLLSFGWEFDQTGFYVVAKFKIGNHDFQVRTLGDKAFEDRFWNLFQEAFDGNLDVVAGHQSSLDKVSPEIESELNRVVDQINKELQAPGVSFEVGSVDPDAGRHEDYWWIGFYLAGIEGGWTVWIDQEVIQRDGKTFWTSLHSEPYEFIVAGYTAKMKKLMTSLLPQRP